MIKVLERRDRPFCTGLIGSGKARCIATYAQGRFEAPVHGMHSGGAILWRETRCVVTSDENQLELGDHISRGTVGAKIY